MRWLWLGRIYQNDQEIREAMAIPAGETVLVHAPGHADQGFADSQVEVPLEGPELFAEIFRRGAEPLDLTPPDSRP